MNSSLVLCDLIHFSHLIASPRFLQDSLTIRIVNQPELPMFSLPRQLPRVLTAYSRQLFSASFVSQNLTREIAASAVVPPSLFNNPGNVPQQYGVVSQKHPQNPEPEIINGSESENYPPPLRGDRSFKDLLSLLAMVALAYLAIDNYTDRVKIEKLNTETTAINLKTLQLQQQNFLNARKQQELKLLRERMDVSKRCYKMALHIALLRKQLEDLGVEAADINVVLLEFEKNVRVNNSVQNLTGQAIWLADDSNLNGYIPDYREYDKKGVLET